MLSCAGKSLKKMLLSLKIRDNEEFVPSLATFFWFATFQCLFLVIGEITS